MPQQMLSLSQTTTKTLLDAVAVSSQTTVYSPAIVIEDGKAFSLFLKVAGDHPHVKISRCYNPSVWLNAGQPDDTMWAETDVNGNADVLVDDFQATSWSISQERPACSVWMRYKIDGLDTNGGDTTISMNWVMKKENPGA